MSVAQFEDLCDAGKISATLETFVLEMTPTDRAKLEQEQPDQFAQCVQDLHRIGFGVPVLELVGVLP